jgi:GT2 family glycosyltransferase
MPPPEISICILAGHGVDALEACLQSLRAQISPPPFELLVGANPTPAALSVVHRHFPEAQVCYTGPRLPGAARNPLIERARGELLLFLDDDATAPPDLLSRLAQLAARHPEASVFGGPNETPPRSSRFEIVQGAVLSSVVGSGPVCRRYGARHAGFADERWFTLCNLAIRREAMLPFVNELVCAEENDLLCRLRARGERMRYEPELRVFHARRPTRRSFAKQMFKYGRGRGQLLARQPGTLRAAYLAPGALLLYLLLTPALIAWTGRPAIVLAPVALYGGLASATALWIAWTMRRLTDAALAAALIVTVHLCYGGGVLRGLFSSRTARDQGAARWTSADSALASARRQPARPAQQSIGVGRREPDSGIGPDQ